jgi:hypothetical protein
VAGLVSAGIVSAAGLSGSGATGVAGIVLEAAGAALVSEAVVAAAAGSAGVIVGAGLVSAGGGVAGLVSVGIVAAGGFCDLGATGATDIGVGPFVVAVAAGIVALAAGVVVLAAGVVVLAGTVLVVSLLGCAFTAPGEVTTTGGAWVCCLSNSLIFCSKAARAAAWTGVSSARTEMKLAQMTTAQTVGNNFMICISLFYVNFSSDATAFPVVKNNFCHIHGRG